MSGEIPWLDSGSVGSAVLQRHRGSMRSEKIARRGFLKTAGVALGGSALIALPERAIALGAAENNFAYDVRAFGGRFRRVERLENASPCFGGHVVLGVNRIKHFHDPSEEPRAPTRWVNAFEIGVLQRQATSASPPGKPHL